MGEAHNESYPRSWGRRRNDLRDDFQCMKSVVPAAQYSIPRIVGYVLAKPESNNLDTSVGIPLVWGARRT